MNGSSFDSLPSFFSQLLKSLDFVVVWLCGRGQSVVKSRIAECRIGRNGWIG